MFKKRAWAWEEKKSDFSKFHIQNLHGFFWIFGGKGNDQDCLFEGLRQSSIVKGDIMYCKEWQKHTWLFVIWVVRTTPTLLANILAESGHFDIFPAYFLKLDMEGPDHRRDQECGIVIVGTLWLYMSIFKLY